MVILLLNSDHGFDCICTLFFLSTMGSYLTFGGSYWYPMLQISLQFAFFMAQWEEYHTHVLPHCVGKWLGVTETNYSMAIITLINSQIDREAFYRRTMSQVLAPLGDAVLQHIPKIVIELEFRHFLMVLWALMSLVLMTLSLLRVMFHPNIVGDGNKSSADIGKARLNAISRLSTPFALSVAALIVPPTAVRTRYLSVTLGLAFSILTKKMIVFSMAKMKFAAVQFDAVPILLAALWIRYDDRLTKEGADFVLGVLCFWYTFRMLRWVNVTINQICTKLDINCLSLGKRKKD